MWKRQLTRDSENCSCSDALRLLTRALMRSDVNGGGCAIRTHAAPHANAGPAGLANRSNQPLCQPACVVLCASLAAHALQACRTVRCTGGSPLWCHGRIFTRYFINPSRPPNTEILLIFPVTFSMVSSSLRRSAAGLSSITLAILSSERVAAVSSRRRITLACTASPKRSTLTRQTDRAASDRRPAALPRNFP